MDNAPHSVTSATLGGGNEIPSRLTTTGGQMGLFFSNWVGICKYENCIDTLRLDVLHDLISSL